MPNACSALRDRELTCANGFVQVPFCRDAQACSHCETPNGKTPYCLRDELPNHFVSDSGMPMFYRSIEPKEPIQ